ncbi:MAG: IlvD/Edd family dehydratase, partial [Candidatus Entotheonellia bacterium]
MQRGLTSYGDLGFSMFIRRAFSKAMGLSNEDLEKPVIGICNTWSELNPCHRHLREVADAVKRGVWQAGGLPLEFPTISLGETFLSPTSMLLRNLMAMDTEEMIRAQPLDGVVLLGGCDKTLPAQLMGAASADVPAIIVTTGPMLSGRYDHQHLGACTDCRRFWVEHRAGTLSTDELDLIEGALCPSVGTCMVMGTASTMASIAEALGMALPGCAAIPAPLSERLRMAEASGRRMVGMVQENLTPSRILSPEAFDNAIRVLMAVGGSTNAVIHLVAVAGRAGVALPLERFDQLSRETPLLVSVRPSGRFHMEELYEAGGIPAVMKEMEPLLHHECMTVTGKTVEANLRSVRRPERFREVIAPLDSPLQPEGGLAILQGNLAPAGAVIKQSAASGPLFQHRGRAVVFSSLEDLEQRVDDPDLDITPDDVMVLQNAGPVGAPGMPEAGYLPIPKKLLAKGVRDMVRISDARMSGTAFGTVILHVSPEAAVGGPLGLVQTGDLIELDVPNRRLDLLVPDHELNARRMQWQPTPLAYTRGYG